MLAEQFRFQRLAGVRVDARQPAEIGDDRSRFADARGLKAHAGAAPITRASGTTLAVLHRRVKNQRLAAVGYTWAFAVLTAAPGARAHYDRRRADGDRHAAAQRNLFGHLLGCLHHCVVTGQHYDEGTAFPSPTPATRAIAARRLNRIGCLHRFSKRRRTNAAAVRAGVSSARTAGAVFSSSCPRSMNALVATSAAPSR